MRILVVEDEQHIARFLKQGLEQEGHVVQIAQDGAAALARARLGSYGLILLDWSVCACI